MNQAASHLASRKVLQGVVQNGRFYRQEGLLQGSHKQKKGLLQAGSPSFGGRPMSYHGDYLTSVDLPFYKKREQIF